MPPNPALRIPVKLHKQVTLIRTADPILAGRSQVRVIERRDHAMRWPGPRFTVRRAMLAVLVIAILLGVTLPAIKVSRDSAFHVHAWVNPDGVPSLPPGIPITDHLPATLSQVEMRSAPFWPRYWRCLLGRPWRGQPCLAPTRLAEACEYAHPGMVRRHGDGSFDIQWSPQILAEMRKRDPSMTMPSTSPPRSSEGP